MKTRISVRLLAFNLLLVFLPVAAFLYLDTYERQLLASLEHALVQQGRFLAAALSGQGPLSPLSAKRLLLELRRQHEARLRIVDPQGRLLADSSRLGPKQPETPETFDYRDRGEESSPETLTHPLYRLASFPVRLYRRLFAPPQPPLESGEYYSSTEVLLGPEILEALAGRYGAMTRISAGGQRSVTLYSALPVRDKERVTGAVLVSQSTYRILRDLYELRLQIFVIFLVSIAAAVGMSLLVSTTISGPIRRLRAQAQEILDRRGRLRGRFPVSRRKDEIGDLARGLRELTGKLEAHLAFIESFAADLSHELKNPLASIRSAAEMAEQAEGSPERERLVGVIQHEVARMEHLLAGVREITWIDSRLEEEDREEIDAQGLSERIAEAARLRRASRGGVTPDIRVTQPMAGHDGRLRLRLSPRRLEQVLENLIDNALCFSPPGGTVEVVIDRRPGWAVIRILDRGPGIPPQHLSRIFDRFFSYRPEAASTGRQADRLEHPGLGLAIVKAIVEGYGGTVTAANREGGGASFEVRLPLLRGARRSEADEEAE